MARMTEVEVKLWFGEPRNRKFDWQPISVSAALRLRDDVFRCPECFGRVTLMSASEKPPMEAHGEHRARNRGCSLGDCFDGVKRPHPNPVR